MSGSEQFDVAYVAQLARMNLTPAEKALFQKQLSDVLHYMEKLRELDVSHVEAASHAIPVSNVFREDVPKPNLKIEEFLKTSPKSKGRFFEVPKIIEDKS